MVHLETVTVIDAPVERCFDLARSVEVHLLGNVHFGEQVVAEGGVTSGLVGLGERVTWKAKHFGLWHRLTSEITHYDRPASFQDVMIRGPFAAMKHDHHFRGLTDGSTEMTDLFDVAAPFPVLGRIAEALVLRRYMFKLLEERNRVVKQVAESTDWRKYLSA